MKDITSDLFTVVDEQDTIIAYKTRFECHHNKKFIHRAVDIVLFDGQGRILLQKRSKQKDTYPGYYTISASGHVDKGESYEQAIRREMKEELGVEDVNPLFVDTYIVRTEDETEMTTLFTGVLKSEVHFATDEIESIIYKAKQDCADMKKIMTPGCIAALYKLHIL